jgi:Tyrosine phosphatase family
VKLNEATTGSDAYYCDAVGIELHALPIPDWEAQSKLTDPSVLEHIDAAIDGCDGVVLVHCTGGVDRTGIAVARYRVRRDHWTKGAALEEWIAYGSHNYRGLVDAWNGWTPQPQENAK